MNRYLHGLVSKITLLSATFICSSALFAQVNPANDALAMNNPKDGNTYIYGATGESTETSAAMDKELVAGVTSYTSVNDISLQNYFNLVGMKVLPYMQVADATQSFDPQIIDADHVSFTFRTNTIDVLVDGEMHSFEIVNIEHYQNTSDKCLIKSKIDVELKSQKINHEKVDNLSIFVDRENHISFIQLGDTEYYLRP